MRQINDEEYVEYGYFWREKQDKVKRALKPLIVSTVVLVLLAGVTGYFGAIHYMMYAWIGFVVLVALWCWWLHTISGYLSYIWRKKVYIAYVSVDERTKIEYTTTDMLTEYSRDPTKYWNGIIEGYLLKLRDVETGELYQIKVTKSQYDAVDRDVRGVLLFIGEEYKYLCGVRKADNVLKVVDEVLAGAEEIRDFDIANYYVDTEYEPVQPTHFVFDTQRV